ncbi:MAG: hypothetical protein AVDCRST_MAG16-1987 [uncultured Frankineae bacterium]|uniref:Uncharacterized protein n=1 Tax=uncultured Frankineae bacterium TaxID=437475 RepID=A0A6J4LXC7_9ACTN|nr:MAG: hypothetical protein AVDCRST_MAG16-1987 [uncultured Frankineae bacterium]
MRQGSYLLTGSTASEVVERFTCGPDGDGWTYAAVREDPGTGAPLGRLQLRLDATGATSRLHVETGAWVVRGGCVGGAVLWRRGEQEGEDVAAGFWGTSPAYALAALRRLRLAVGDVRRLRLVEVTEPVLALRLVDQSWTRAAVDRWRVDDLATGERRVFESDGDVVVAGTGLTLTHP